MEMDVFFALDDTVHTAIWQSWKTIPDNQKQKSQMTKNKGDERPKTSWPASNKQYYNILYTSRIKCQKILHLPDGGALFTLFHTTTICKMKEKQV